MAHHLRLHRTPEQTLDVEFFSALERASEQRTVAGVMQHLRTAQELRNKAGEIGCDGDLLYETNNEIMAINVIDKLLELVDDGTLDGRHIDGDFGLCEDQHEPMDAYDRQLLDEERELARYGTA